MKLSEWRALTALTGTQALSIERVRLRDTGVAVEGAFELPPLAQLTAEDQVFVAAFVRCHGSIKQMEKFFGVSYPTIKNRLNRIAAQLPFAELDSEAPAPSVRDLLSQLERGEITVRDAIARMRGHHDDNRD